MRSRICLFRMHSQTRPAACACDCATMALSVHLALCQGKLPHPLSSSMCLGVRMGSSTLLCYAVFTSGWDYRWS
jgi:ABC-type Fe3+-siderophore transport system permease subunit